MYVKYAFFDGTDWNPESVVPMSYNQAYPPISLAFDPAGLPVIGNMYSGELMVARHDGSDWRIQTVDSGGRTNSIAIGPDGEPAIAYPCGVLKFTRFDGSNWTLEDVDEAGDWTSLAFDQNGRPAISYRKNWACNFAWCY
jgi:hypothetical protein